jgi:hypothetical protein
MTEYRKQLLIELLEKKELAEYLEVMYENLMELLPPGSHLSLLNPDYEVAMAMAAPPEEVGNKRPAKWSPEEIDRVFEMWKEQVPQEFDPENLLQL